MPKKCNRCGAVNSDNNPFCTNCGARFVESISNFKKSTDEINNFEKKPQDDSEEKITYEKESKIRQEINEQSNYYEPSYPPEESNKKKPMIAIITILIVLILVAATFIVIFNQDKGNEIDEYINSIKSKIEGGPTVSMQSLACGNFQSIPQEGSLAKYYLYNQGEKVGEAYEVNTGETNYNGINCYKMLGRSNIDMTYQSTEIAFVMDYTYYIKTDNNIPIYMEMDYDYSQPQDMKASSEISWDENTGEIKMTMPNSNQEMIMDFPQEYWGIIDSVNDLYVGYSNEFEYTMTISGSTNDVNMDISINEQEDVTVPSGTFENCYVIEITQSYSYSTISSQKIWISEDGFVPKVELNSSGMDITQELEGYYTTN